METRPSKRRRRMSGSRGATMSSSCASGNAKLLELAKGQPGIAFESKDELVQAIDWVAAEVAKGTYDKQLEDAAMKSRARLQKNKKAKAA